jgi:hypothetical protein
MMLKYRHVWCSHVNTAQGLVQAEVGLPTCEVMFVVLVKAGEQVDWQGRQIAAWDHVGGMLWLLPNSSAQSVVLHLP